MQAELINKITNEQPYYYSCQLEIDHMTQKPKKPVNGHVEDLIEQKTG